MPRAPAITLTSAMLLPLLNDPGLQARFPSIRGIAQKAKASGGGCKCSTNRAAAQNDVIEAFKQQILAWPPEMKQWLRDKFNADKVRLFAGKVMREI